MGTTQQVLAMDAVANMLNTKATPKTDVTVKPTPTT